MLAAFPSRNPSKRTLTFASHNNKQIRSFSWQIYWLWLAGIKAQCISQKWNNYVL